MPDLSQININITDTIPPENFATIDKNAIVGTVYTKAQDNAWRAEVEQNVTSGIKGVAKPDDTIPATGFFRMLADTATTYTNYIGVNDAPIEVTDADLNIINGIQRNEVIFEVTDGVTEKKVFAKVGEDGANGTAEIPNYDPALSYVEKSTVIKDNSIWRVVDGQTALVTDVPGVSDKWVSLGKNLDLDVAGGVLSYDSVLSNKKLIGGLNNADIPVIVNSTIAEDGITLYNYGVNYTRSDFMSGFAGTTVTLKLKGIHIERSHLFIYDLDKILVSKSKNIALGVIEEFSFTFQNDCFFRVNTYADGFTPKISMTPKSEELFPIKNVIQTLSPVMNLASMNNAYYGSVVDQSINVILKNGGMLELNVFGNLTVNGISVRDEPAVLQNAGGVYFLYTSKKIHIINTPTIKYFRYLRVKGLKDNLYDSITFYSIFATDINENNVSIGKPVSSSKGTVGQALSVLTNGNTGQDPTKWVAILTNGVDQEYFQIDLERIYGIHRISLFRAMGRTYYDNDIEISVDGNEWQNVYHSDSEVQSQSNFQIIFS